MRNTSSARRLRIASVAAFLLCSLGSQQLWAKEPCREQDISRPQPPQMIEANLDLVRGGPGQNALPEWSKIEKLRDIYREHATASAPCILYEGEDIALRLFMTRSSIDEEEISDSSGRFAAQKGFQFYGRSRLKVERADKEVTREFAFPVKGSVDISDVAGNELPVLLEDLAQMQLVSVPRFVYRQVEGDGQKVDCFLVSNVTVVPSRVFEEPPPAAPAAPGEARLTLDARRRALELVARQTDWLQRMDKEPPGCRADEAPGYLGRQVTSLNLTIRELVPEVDFVAQSLRFWREVEQRVERLRAEEEAWKKEISSGGRNGR